MGKKFLGKKLENDNSDDFFAPKSKSGKIIEKIKANYEYEAALKKLTYSGPAIKDIGNLNKGEKDALYLYLSTEIRNDNDDCILGALASVCKSTETTEPYFEILKNSTDHDDENIRKICGKLGLMEVDANDDAAWNNAMASLDDGKRAFVQADALYAKGQSHAYCGIEIVGKQEGKEGIISWDPDKQEGNNLKLIPRSKVDLMFIEK